MSLSDDFKQALGRWASGVSVVTTDADGMLYGLTVSSFTSLSLEPPLVLVCINTGNRLPAMVEQSGGFAVSILAEGQEDASNYFARSGREPTPDFVEVPGAWSRAGQPVIKDALAYLVCRKHDALVMGDHTILVGEVVETAVRDDLRPLVYYHRGYRELGDG